MEDLAHAVTEKKIEASNSSDTFTLSFQAKNGKTHSSSYRKLKRNRKTKDDATVKARNNFVQLKANEISEHIKMDKLDVDIQEMILQKIADNHDFMLINEEALVLTAVQCMVVRNYVQTSTNGMYRLKQVLEVFCPQLKGKLLPADLRRILQELEQTGVVPAIACRIELETAQDKKKKAIRVYYYVSKPGQILELQVARSILDGSYRNSIEICSKSNKLIMVFGNNKSDTDLLCSQRVANRKDGNSRNHVQALGCAEKCAETYHNCNLTICSNKFPTQRYLQNCLNDNYQMLVVTIGSKLHSGVRPQKATCALFLPYPVSKDPCTDRHLKVTFNSEPVDEDKVMFDVLPDKEKGLPPKVALPVDQNDITLQLIEHIQQAPFPAVPPAGLRRFVGDARNCK